MKKILITGATGNVGKAVLKNMIQSDFRIYAGVRNIEKSKKELNIPGLRFYQIDFESGEGFDFTENFDSVFLLRPPQIGDVERYIFPIIDKIRYKINNIIFLSVQGADKKNYLPHAKIEKKILESGLDYIFLRPSYFMENLITTLYSEIKNNRRIYLPSGDKKFNWIDVDDVGKITAHLMFNFDKYKNSAYELTSPESYSFYEITEKINQICGSDIKYKSPWLIEYIFNELKKKTKIDYIAVMLLLHYLPKFENDPVISRDYSKIMGCEPSSIDNFIEKNKEKFI